MWLKYHMRRYYDFFTVNIITKASHKDETKHRETAYTEIHAKWYHDIDQYWAYSKVL